jgi:peptidoglycan/xylan/chitin deacetylase (PgdA/CDA1 family)
MYKGLAAAGGVALAGAGFLAWAVRGRSSRVFGDSVWRGGNAAPQLALTFDDGPSESTPALLEILARHRIPATFFMCGRNVERCPSIARDAVAAGHEPGNHSHTHPRFDFKSLRPRRSLAPRPVSRRAGSARLTACAGLGWPKRSGIWGSPERCGP